LGDATLVAVAGHLSEWFLPAQQRRQVGYNLRVRMPES
jgi:hypothetical protein